jgi:hypothetical protein
LLLPISKRATSYRHGESLYRAEMLLALQEVEARCARFRPVALADVAHALARLGAGGAAALHAADALAAAAEPQLQASFGPSALARLLWALAKLGHELSDTFWAAYLQARLCQSTNKVVHWLLQLAERCRHWHACWGPAKLGLELSSLAACLQARTSVMLS